MRTFTDSELAAVAEREVKQRKRVYPRLVEKGSMTQEDADFETNAMQEMARYFRNRANPTLL